MSDDIDLKKNTAIHTSQELLSIVWSDYSGACEESIHAHANGDDDYEDPAEVLERLIDPISWKNPSSV